MGIKARAILKSWFKRGSYPTESHFGDLIDSMRHKEEKISISEVSGLSEELNRKSNSRIEQTVANHDVEIKMLQDVAWGTSGSRLAPIFDGFDTGEDLQINWNVGYNSADEVVYLSNYGIFAVKVSGAAGVSEAMRIVGGYGYEYYPVFSSETRRESDYQTVASGIAKIHETKIFRLKDSDELYVWQSSSGRLERTSKVEAKDLNIEISLIVSDGELLVRSNRELKRDETMWLMRNGRYTTEKRIRIDKATIEAGETFRRKGWRRYQRSHHKAGESYGIEMPFSTTLVSGPLRGRNLVGGGGPQYWTYKIGLTSDVIIENLAYIDTKGNDVYLSVRNGSRKKRLLLGKYNENGKLIKQSKSVLYGIGVFCSKEESPGKMHSERVSNISPFRIEVRNYKYNERGNILPLEDFRGQGELEGYCAYRVM